MRGLNWGVKLIFFTGVPPVVVRLHALGSLHERELVCPRAEVGGCYHTPLFIALNIHNHTHDNTHMVFCHN